MGLVYSDLGDIHVNLFQVWFVYSVWISFTKFAPNNILGQLYIHEANSFFHRKMIHSSEEELISLNGTMNALIFLLC